MGISTRTREAGRSLKTPLHERAFNAAGIRLEERTVLSRSTSYVDWTKHPSQRGLTVRYGADGLLAWSMEAGNMDHMPEVARRFDWTKRNPSSQSCLTEARSAAGGELCVGLSGV